MICLKPSFSLPTRFSTGTCVTLRRAVPTRWRCDAAHTLTLSNVMKEVPDGQTPMHFIWVVATPGMSRSTSSIESPLAPLRVVDVRQATVK